MGEGAREFWEGEGEFACWVREPHLSEHLLVRGFALSAVRRNLRVSLLLGLSQPSCLLCEIEGRTTKEVKGVVSVWGGIVRACFIFISTLFFRSDKGREGCTVGSSLG